MTEQYPDAPAGGYTTPPQVWNPYADPWSAPTSAAGGAGARPSPSAAGGRWRHCRPSGWSWPCGLVQAPVGAYAAVASENLSGVTDPTTADLTAVFTVLGFGLMGVLVAIVLSAAITIATVHVGVSIALGAPTRIGDAVAYAARRVFPLLGWRTAGDPDYLLGLCLCFLPVFYVAAVFVVLPVVVAVERTGRSAAASGCSIKTWVRRSRGPRPSWRCSSRGPSSAA